MGFLASFIFIAAMRRFDGKRPFSVAQSVLLTIGFYPLTIDVITSYLGLRESSNFIRYLTGVLFGYAIPFFLIFIKNFRIGRENKGIIVRFHEALFIIGAAFAPYYLFQINSPIIYYLAGVLVSVSIYLTYYCVSYYFVVMLFKIRGQAQKLLCAFLPFLIISMLSNFNFIFKL